MKEKVIAGVNRYAFDVAVAGGVILTPVMLTAVLFYAIFKAGMLSELDSQGFLFLFGTTAVGLFTCVLMLLQIMSHQPLMSSKKKKHRNKKLVTNKSRSQGLPIEINNSASAEDYAIVNI